jgi:multicomponent Na+:H+ antiporter subunit G
MDLILDLISWAFILPGAFFLIVSGVGMIRMPDVYTRMHAAGIADTMGADLILTGLIFQSGISLISLKIVLILGFLFLTSPVSTHAMARAALEGGVEPLTRAAEED